jgi:hypothetical protein
MYYCRPFINPLLTASNRSCIQLQSHPMSGRFRVILMPCQSYVAMIGVLSTNYNDKKLYHRGLFGPPMHSLV